MDETPTLALTFCGFALGLAIGGFVMFLSQNYYLTADPNPIHCSRDNISYWSNNPNAIHCTNEGVYDPETP